MPRTPFLTTMYLSVVLWLTVVQMEVILDLTPNVQIVCKHANPYHVDISGIESPQMTDLQIRTVGRGIPS